MAEVDTTADLINTAPARSLDLRGQTCPTTTDETLRALEGMRAGEVLEVISDYYPARSTIPYHCDKRRYRYIFVDDGFADVAACSTSWRIRIQKS
jgi:TusA-related sulfurtransferase